MRTVPQYITVSTHLFACRLVGKKTFWNIVFGSCLQDPIVGFHSLIIRRNTNHRFQTTHNKATLLHSRVWKITWPVWERSWTSLGRQTHELKWLKVFKPLLFFSTFRYNKKLHCASLGIWQESETMSHIINKWYENYVFICMSSFPLISLK